MQIPSPTEFTSKTIAETVVAAGILPATDSAGSWDDHWKALMAEPSSRTRDAEMLAAIEELAARDSARAISLALNEPRLRMRQDFLRAALRGWTQVSPDAAVDWALSQQNVLSKTDAVGAVFTGLAQDPEALLRLNARLAQQNPDLAGSFGMALINAFSASGDFVRAANFASTASLNNQLDWVTLAYHSWADYQPQSALAAATALADPSMQKQALDAAFHGWGKTDAKAAADWICLSRKMKLTTTPPSPPFSKARLEILIPPSSSPNSFAKKILNKRAITAMR